MKNLFLLLLPVAFLMSCGGVEKYRGPIEELAANWSETTNSVTAFAEQLNGTVGSANEAISAMTLSEEQMQDANDELTTQWTAAKSGVSTALSGFGAIQQELGDFMKTWTEKSADLTALTEGLAAGKLEGNVMEKINGLKETAASAASNLESWTEGFGSANTGLQEALGQLKSVYTSITEG